MPSRKNVDPERPVGTAEIVRRYGLTRNQFEGYRRYKSASDPKMDVPAPDWPTVGGNPAWRVSSIDAWGRYRQIAPAMSWVEACEPQPRKAIPKRAAPSPTRRGKP